MTDAPSKPPAKRSAILRRVAYAIVAAIAFLAILAFGISAQQPGESLIAEWNTTIQNMGMEPVFPPEEELSVGDILAVVVKDRRPEHADPQNIALLNRSIKLGHINLDYAITETYNEEYVFPETKERPTEDGKIWEQNAAAGDLFEHPAKRNRLALTAFPGFSIHSKRDLSLSAALRGLFGLSTSTVQDVEFSIPFVETYGVLSSVALAELEKYCATHPECADNFVRQHLAFVSPGVMQVDDSVSTTGQGGYLVDVTVELVNRIYLVRAIDEKINNQQSRTSAASTSNAAPPVPPATNSSAGGDSSGAAAQPTASSPNQLFSAKAGANFDAGSSLKEIFERPLVIGYRSVKRVLASNAGIGPAPNLVPGQALAPNLAPGQAPTPNLAPGQAPAPNLAPGQGPGDN